MCFEDQEPSLGDPGIGEQTPSTEALVARVELAHGYSVPRVIQGCWQLSSGHGELDIEEPELLRRLAERVRGGFDTFDCADIYTGVEELLGRLRRHVRRELDVDIQVHTKLVPDLDALENIDRRSVERIVDRSLCRLGVERLDLVQFHWWSYDVPRYLDVAGWLVDLIDAGKVHQLGLTNFDTQRTAELLEAGLPITSTQVQWSMLDRRPARGLAELCQRRGVSALGYGALAGGFLSDRWLGAADPGSPGSLANRSLVKYRLILEEVGGWPALQRLLRVLEKIARRRGVSISTVALLWTLQQPAGQGPDAVLLGVGDGSHDLSSIARSRLSSGELEELQLALPEQLPGDVYAIERDRHGPHGRIMKYDLNDSG